MRQNPAFPCLLVLGALCSGTTPPANAQTALSLTAAVARWQSAGLKLAWQGQVDVARTDQGIAYATLHVSGKHVSKAYEVVYDGGSRLFAAQYLDRHGRPLGEAGAAHLADVESRVLATRGIQAKIVEHDTPLVTLYVQTSRGLLYAYNAETGEVRWRFPTGNPDFPSLRPTANDDYAAVINGSTLYVIALADGKLAFERDLAGAPGAGPAMTDDYVFVPLVGGMVDAYRLAEDQRHRPPFRFSSSGDIQAHPTVSPRSVSWPTDRGHLYVADAKEGFVRFRVEARSDLVANSAFLAPNRLFVASVDGYLFCVAEDTGLMLWQFSAGESLTTAPLAVDDRVYVASERGGLFAVDAATGKELWNSRGNRRVVTVDGAHVYGLRTNRQLSILDRETGSLLDELPLPLNAKLVENTVSDRLYLTTASGRILCVRRQDAPWPTIHVELKIEPADTAPPEEEKVTPAAPTAPETPAEKPEDIWGQPAGEGNEEDIFGGEPDIFGGGGTDAAGGNDEDVFGDGSF